MPNKCYAYLLKVERSNLVFLKTCNNGFDEIIKTFTDQNGRPLQIEDNISHFLLITRNDTLFYRTKKKKIC